MLPSLAVVELSIVLVHPLSVTAEMMVKKKEENPGEKTKKKEEDEARPRKGIKTKVVALMEPSIVIEHQF